MTDEKKLTSIRLEEELLEKSKKKARQEGMTFTDFVRKSLYELNDNIDKPTEQKQKLGQNFDIVYQFIQEFLLEHLLLFFLKTLNDFLNSKNFLKKKTMNELLAQFVDLIEKKLKDELEEKLKDELENTKIINPRDAKEIIIGCQEYTEQYILCAIITVLLRERKSDCQITPKYNFGDFDNIWNVIIGNLDIYPAYTWQGLEFNYSDLYINKDIRKDIRKKYIVDPIPNEDEARKTILKLNCLYKGKVQWIGYLGFNNDWNIVVKEDYAISKNLETISDLKSCKNIKFGGEPGFLRRPNGFNILNDPNGYGLGIKRENVIEIKHEKVLRLLEKEEVQVVNAFTTDPQINNRDRTFRLLKDDKSCFGRYYSSIIASPMLLQKHPDCYSILSLLDEKINRHEISKMIDDIDKKFKNESLNTSNELSGEKIAYIENIAYDFLRRKGLI